MSNDYLDKLLQSKKYREVCPDTIRRVWAECEPKYKKPKDVDKAVREALHGITGAFLTPAEASGCAYSMHCWAVSASPWRTWTPSMPEYLKLQAGPPTSSTWPAASIRSTSARGAYGPPARTSPARR